MKILVLNAGSSSLKYNLFDNEKVLIKGQIDAIGRKNCEIWITIDKETIKKPIRAKKHHDALTFALNSLIEYKVIKKLNEVKAVGHRIVHGGEYFHKAAIITQSVINKIKKLQSLAPLHNPHNLAGIFACKKILPKAKQVAVFDTAFHQTMPKKAFMYALPLTFYKNDKIRRYGFHGTSNKYIAEQTFKILRKKGRIITCHLGNGLSLTAINNGKSVDTSMGLTPLEGIPMGSRCGNLGPEIPIFLARKESIKRAEEILNKESGFLGLSGTTDMREIYKRSLKGDKKSKFVLELLAYKIAQYIGSYTTTMGGLDALVFTGGIGENAFYVRKDVCSYLKWMGLELDAKKNRKNEIDISGEKSKIYTFVIPTNEELQIARETRNILKKSNGN